MPPLSRIMHRRPVLPYPLSFLSCLSQITRLRVRECSAHPGQRMQILHRYNQRRRSSTGTVTALTKQTGLNGMTRHCSLLTTVSRTYLMHGSLFASSISCETRALNMQRNRRRQVCKCGTEPVRQYEKAPIPMIAILWMVCIIMDGADMSCWTGVWIF